jgi:hypothetical protein
VHVGVAVAASNAYHRLHSWWCRCLLSVKQSLLLLLLCDAQLDPLSISLWLQAAAPTNPGSARLLNPSSPRSLFSTYFFSCRCTRTSLMRACEFCVCSIYTAAHDCICFVYCSASNFAASFVVSLPV